MDDYAYKPRLGFDIRIKPPEGGRTPNRRKSHEVKTRRCEAPGCERKADVRAPKSPRAMKEHLWFCAEHAREHNRKWNFFDGMSEAEQELHRKNEIYGHRPTWKMFQNGRAAAAGRISGDASHTVDDALGVFGEMRPRETPSGMREGRRLTRLQAKAFETLHLPVNAPNSEIRARYADLVKRYHPDANGGQRGSEERLSEVIRAHQILKKAGFC